MLEILRRLRRRFLAFSKSSSFSSPSESVSTEIGVSVPGLDATDEVGRRLARVVVNLSKEDICRKCVPCRSVGWAVEVAGGGKLGRLERVEDLPPRLKFRSLASVLWFDVSERALKAGEGGDRSGRGMSGIGGFQ